MSRTRAEMETTVRYDLESGDAHGCTADPKQAVRWRKLGYVVTAFGFMAGQPVTWVTTFPKRLLRFRRVQDGRVVRSGLRGGSGRFTPSNPPLHRASGARNGSPA